MQSLLDWVTLHSEYAIFAVFIVSMMESLALVGIMIPGMLFMLGVGTLIGVGSLPFWPMFVAATLGAIAGDGLSFWLGRHFNRNLRHIWPLPKFPGLLQKGEDFFHRHGAMSVLFGRFVGPLRAIIPAVAGMLQMQPGRFLVFNILSALAWSPVVLLPGAVLGASLAQVSSVAMRFGLLLLFIGFAFWCLGWIINHLLQRFAMPRFPRLHHPEAWRVITHGLVYCVLTLVLLQYGIDKPELPSIEKLRRLALAPPPQNQGEAGDWQFVFDTGVDWVWLGDQQRLQAILKAQGWRRGERWSMSSAFGWLADDKDVLQLVYSDPRELIYKDSLKETAWIKRSRGAEIAQVYVLHLSLMKINPSRGTDSKSQALVLARLQHYEVVSGFMGYRYYHAYPESADWKRKLLDTLFAGQSSTLHMLASGQLGQGLIVWQGDANPAAQPSH